MTEAKSRRPNFSEDEVAALVAAVKSRSHILNPAHRGDGASENSITNTMKCKAWREVTEIVNATGKMDRSIAEVTRKYKNYKSKTRAINAENIREMNKTGGGTPCLKQLNPTQVMVIESIPKAALTGIEGGIDLHDMGTTMDKPVGIPTLEIVSHKASEIPCCSKDVISEPINEVDTPRALSSVPERVEGTQPCRRSMVTPTESTFFPKRKRMETSRVESLMEDQVKSVNRQVEVLEEIKDLIKERNDTEAEKLNIMRQLLEYKRSKRGDIDESGCSPQVNTINDPLFDSFM